MAFSDSSSESLRDHYLHNLGIVQYTSKDRRDSKTIDAPVSAVQENQELYTSQTQSVIDEVVVDIGSSADKQLQLPQAMGAASTSADQLELSFALWQPRDDFLIATLLESELPDSQQSKLLTNLVLAIDKTLPTLPQFEAVKWPPHSHIKGGEQEAREFLSTLIDVRISALSVKTLLLLGEATAHWLLSSQDDVNLNQGIYSLSATTTALVVNSLPEMLANPQCKQITWGRICRYLSSHTI